jgi:hypothetical protein
MDLLENHYIRAPRHLIDVFDNTYSLRILIVDVVDFFLERLTIHLIQNIN